MNLNNNHTKKHTFLVCVATLLTASTTLLSCSDGSVSRDKAASFVNEHYTKVDIKHPTKIHYKWDFSSAEGKPTTKAYFLLLIYNITEKEDATLSGEYDDPKPNTFDIFPITSGELPSDTSLTTCKFYIDTKNVILKIKTNSEENVKSHSIKMETYQEYNNEGYEVKENINYLKYKLIDEGETHGYINTTYTY